MHTRFTYFLIACICLHLPNYAQKIVYSDIENKDFDRFKFDVIAKKNDKILVYKATYFASPFSAINTGPDYSINPYVSPEPTSSSAQNKISAPNTSIEESSICIYDLQMKVLDQVILPLPKEISGVHFLVYPDYFYIFYQYQKGHSVYCMAAKIGMDGKMIGAPLEMDRTDIMDINYQSQIYSVIYSENKRHIIAFKVDIHNLNGYELTAILFDQDLHTVKSSSCTLEEGQSLFFTEFNIDNEGSLIFIGLPASRQKYNDTKAYLFKLRAGINKISYLPINIASSELDYLRLIVDNEDKRYVLASFYSKVWGGSIRGINVTLVDASNNHNLSITNSILGDSIRNQLSKNPATAFDNYYIQNIQIRKDGGFVIEAQELFVFPQSHLHDRWNYLQYFSEMVASSFVFFDTYEFYRYYPWKEWRYLNNNYSFTSSKTLFMSFNRQGLIEWVNVMNTPQSGRHASIGYKSIVANNQIYLVFNQSIRSKAYLIVQSINSSGEINADKRLREDMELKDVNNEYTHFPRFAKMVSPNELIFPCRKGMGHICLAKVEF